jgi:hypothetical protein
MNPSDFKKYILAEEIEQILIRNEQDESVLLMAKEAAKSLNGKAETPSVESLLILREANRKSISSKFQWFGKPINPILGEILVEFQEFESRK